MGRVVRLFATVAMGLVVGCGVARRTPEAKPAVAGVGHPAQARSGSAVQMDGDAARLGPVELRLVDAPPVTSRTAGVHQVELRRGDLVEWYQSSPLGLEQGFDVARATPEITLRVAVSGARPVQAGDGQIALVNDAGHIVMRYGEAYAKDSRGTSLPVRLVAERDAIAIRVAARRAVFPVVIDPLMWTEQQTLVSDNIASNDHFGQAVGLSSDTALIGAPQHAPNGAAYVFVRSGTSFAQQTMLTASDGATGDAFGVSVGLDGDTALVGSPNNSSIGAAYVFVNTGGIWSQQAKLVASNGTANDKFGFSVALSGDTALVGTYRPASAAGEAYVFVRSGTTWTEQKRLVPTDSAAYDSFGTAVALDGDTAVVGSEWRDNAAGAAYVFVRNGTSWSEQAKLVASDRASNDHLGTAVAVNGDTAIVGATAKNVGAGAAYVFVRNGTTWTQQQKLVASDPANYASFGGAIAVDGNVAFVSATTKDTGTGATYVFVRNGTTWTQQQELVASTPTTYMEFGVSLAYSGLTALIGAAGVAKEGAAYVYGATPLANGAACTGGAQFCSSGFCADGVCCDTACTGQCEACDGASPGTCSAVVGAPHGNRQACGGDGSACDGTCDGTNRTQCTFPTAGSPCGSPTCTAGTMQTSACDGQGACSAQTPVDCAPYTCDATACKTACTTDSDCAAGYTCTGAACVPTSGKATCSPDGTSSISSSGVVTSCAPYLCDPTTGSCRQVCATNGDCAPGNTCNTSTHSCEGTDAGANGGSGGTDAGANGGTDAGTSGGTGASGASQSNSSGGCGCRAAGGDEPGGAGWIALLALFAIGLRRKERF